MNIEHMALKDRDARVREELKLHIADWIGSKKCFCFKEKGIRECKHQRADFHKKWGKEVHAIFKGLYAERSAKFEEVMRT